MSLYLKGKRRKLEQFTKKDKYRDWQLPKWKRVARILARITLYLWAVGAVLLWVIGLCVGALALGGSTFLGITFTHQILDPFFPGFVAPFGEWLISAILPTAVIVVILIAVLDEFTYSERYGR